MQPLKALSHGTGLLMLFLMRIRITQPLQDRQHPLAHRQVGEHMVAQVRRRLHHAPGVARRADVPALAGEGHEVIVPAVVTGLSNFISLVSSSTCTNSS
jgi:hypothetical protein